MSYVDCRLRAWQTLILRSWPVNAGIAIFGTTAKTTVEDYKKVFDINFFSLISIIGHALPYLKKAEPSGGKIVLVSSGAATGGVASWGAYSSVVATSLHEPSLTSTDLQSLKSSHELSRQNAGQ